MAPATNSKATAAQAQQLLDVLSDLTTEEFQRLLSNGDVLKLIAKVPQSELSARMLREYSSRYVYMGTYYGGGSSSWACFQPHSADAKAWYVHHNGRYVPMLEHYGLSYATSGWQRESMERGIREHWLDYGNWYVRV